MIDITKLNDDKIFFNCDLIEYIESTPDTTITTINGKKLIVKESVEDIIEKIIVYKRKIYCMNIEEKF